MNPLVLQDQCQKKTAWKAAERGLDASMGHLNWGLSVPGGDLMPLPEFWLKEGSVEDFVALFQFLLRPFSQIQGVADEGRLYS